MYESHAHPPISRRSFAKRLIQHLVVAAVLLLFSLGIGMVGYHHFEHLSSIDAFLNSSMLLGGMGPLDPPHSYSGKLFAGFYALYAGLVFVVTAALVFTPIVHRVLHRFHCGSTL